MFRFFLNTAENDKTSKKGFLWGGSDGVDHVAREVLQHGVTKRGGINVYHPLPPKIKIETKELVIDSSQLLGNRFSNRSNNGIKK